MTFPVSQPVPPPAASPPARSRAEDGERSFNIAAHGLRGVAALMVFFAHLLGGAAEHVYARNEGFVAGVLPFWNFGTFGVCLFFVISGFVIVPSARRYGPKEFAARRFMRLYPLFLVLSLIFIALNAKTNLYPATNDPVAILSALTFTNIFNGTDQLTPNAWSLTYEIWFYLFTVAAVEFGIRRKSALGLAIVVAAALLFLVRFPISFYFVGGVMVRLAYDRYEWVRTGRNHLAEILAFLACVTLASRGHHDYDWPDFQTPLVPSLIVATCLYFLFAVSRESLTAHLLDNAVLRYFGTVSYSLYLVHPYTYYAVRETFLREGLFNGPVVASMLAFVVVASLLTALVTPVFHRLFERWPYEAVYRQKIYRVDSPGRRSWLRFGLRPKASPAQSV